MDLLAFPEELLVATFEHLDFTTAKALRLTCKRFAHPASERLFARVHLDATTTSAQKVLGVLEAKYLAPLVKTVVLKPCLAELCDVRHEGDQGMPWWRTEVSDDYMDQNVASRDLDLRALGYGYEGMVKAGEIPFEVSSVFKQALDKIGAFCNLRRLEILHNKWADAPHGSPHRWDGYETREYRNTILRKVVKALNHPKHPATKLRSLAIINLHEVADVEMATSTDYKAVMSRLESLELSIAVFEKRCDPSPYFRIHAMDQPECHRFFARDLRTHWLEPCHQNLLHLKLYSNCYWGYLPKCDLQGLHFPHLKSLALQRMTFTHNWQLDWILSHAATLKLLSLDKCPIVHQVFIAQRLDSEGYPLIDIDKGLVLEPRIHDPQLDLHAYDTRWHTVFRAFRDGLPRLKYFGFEHGVDEDDHPGRSADEPFSPTGWPGPTDDLGYDPADDTYSDVDRPSPTFHPSPNFNSSSPVESCVEKPIPEDRIHVDFATAHAHALFSSSSPHSLPAKLHRFRYVLFHSGSRWRNFWLKAWELDEDCGMPFIYPEALDDSDRTVFYPDCLLEDRKALDELMEVEAIITMSNNAVPLTVYKGAGYEHIPFPSGSKHITADFHSIRTKTDAPAYVTSGFYKVEAGPVLAAQYAFEEAKYVLNGQIDVFDEATGITHHLVPGDFAFFHVGTKVQFSTKSSGFAFYTVTRPVRDPHPNLQGREEKTPGQSRL
ncbi:hypothetical protein Q7P37_000576 [Cladosporium fusiforme]